MPVSSTTTPWLGSGLWDPAWILVRSLLEVMPLLGGGKRLEAGRFSCLIKTPWKPYSTDTFCLEKGIDFGTALLSGAHRHSLVEIVRLVSLDRADPSLTDGT